VSRPAPRIEVRLRPEGGPAICGVCPPAKNPPARRAGVDQWLFRPRAQAARPVVNRRAACASAKRHVLSRRPTAAERLANPDAVLTRTDLEHLDISRAGRENPAPRYLG
jgi:hypothetical protein